MKKDIIKIIEFWNQKREKKIFPRTKIDTFPNTSPEILDIIGVRRSGKSSLFWLFLEKNNINEEEYLLINFEDPFFLSNSSPQIIEEIVEIYIEYFSPNLKYIFFDEIQSISGWEHAVQKLQSREEYTIFVTGSSSKMMSQELSTLLTGRHKSFFLYPFSFQEFLESQNIDISQKRDIFLQEKKLQKYFSQFLEIGGFPQVVTENNPTLLKQYFYDILYKDIMFRYEVREKEVLEKIAVFLLSNSSKFYSLKSLQNQFHISHELASKYVSYLKEAFLLLELSKFSYSLKSQNFAQKKIYAIDTGLAKNISFRFSEDSGRILENATFLHLLKKEKKIFYHREKYECDFLILKKEKISEAIQVCREINDENKKREINGLIEACQVHNLSKGVIITSEQEEIFEQDGIQINYIPAWKYFLD